MNPIHVLLTPCLCICILSAWNTLPNSLLIQILYLFKIQFKVHSSYDFFLDHFLQILVECFLGLTCNIVLLLFIYAFCFTHLTVNYLNGDFISDSSLHWTVLYWMGLQTQSTWIHKGMIAWMLCLYLKNVIIW